MTNKPTTPLSKIAKEIKKETQKAFLYDWFAELFEKHPEVEFFFWEQYTDSFNDGEQCLFHVHHIASATKSPNDIGFEKQATDAFQFYSGIDLDKKIKGENGITYKFLKYVDGGKNHQEVEDLFRFAFGDHARVGIFRNKVIVLDYSDHD